ncbi:hypothetical protein [Celeribacter halophilus]|jgi:hypothetical protein|uniref:Uncharacterized protein n=1 Tax=Celeribacter halophilus TaxID=576117 RepID=A0AAW7XT59_9RHOB|nr:hypothetical protein [Celeribacter halophilus]MDO6456483.1 hypothetical protein [Celeribacter halophilus]MDO6510547.1 hypothetical protein [Celeribacter halophilus]MDO6722946.1 hypothetical protein [Celeribacter halophilus]
MPRAAAFPLFPRPFAALSRALKALSAHEPVPCWTEYLRSTRN